ncbi:hypothetical protein H2198_007307 [Neophaeococcomyces mojaviensis]|uniref:Uncharacterized protein n=1 Tax=Neophaeococcomyces mojaviensis TaxID=3383035 RepID=A0ACC3A125_9EURO|nr:hypothetical protein H2198_007307 [Knufia sp. JES_112]
MARPNGTGTTACIPSAVIGSDRQRRYHPGASHAPTESFSSDKENQDQQTPGSRLKKRKSASTAMSTPMQPQSAAGNKRRRLEENGRGPASQSARRRELADKVDTSYYDPDQDERTKRATLKQLRDLSSQLNDSRAEYLQRGSRGIHDTITQANGYFSGVKQTSVATVDSRLLVNVGDLAYKKINTMSTGDTSTAIDVDDFLSKCIGYMKTAPSDPVTATQSTQRRRPQIRHNNSNTGSDQEGEEDIRELNFAHLGATLCFPASSRPCLSSFLLGPLSVEKKQRPPTQRRAIQRAANANSLQAARPTSLSQEDLDHQESLTLTSICSNIATLLSNTQSRGEKLVEQEVDDLPSEASEAQIRKIMAKHNMADNGGVPLFKFCINPKSFGQTVENFFYVSFLIKEGKFGLDFDGDDWPTLGMVESERTVEKRQETQRNQAVFTLDFDQWEDLVQGLGIEESIIPHRKDDEFQELNLAYRDRDEVSSRNRGRSTTIMNDEEDEDMYGPG